MEYIAAALSIIGGRKAKKEAEEAADIQAAQELQLTKAKLDDLKLEERVMKGSTIASAAASGVKVDKGSPLAVLKEQAKNFAKERMTVSQVGATNASVITKRGKMVGRQALYQGWGQGLQQASNATKSAFAMFG